MTKGKKRNAKTAHKEVQRNNQERQLHFDRDSKRGYQTTSNIEADDSISSSRNDWSGRNKTSSPGGTISGGILKRLIAETDNQIIELRSRCDKLEIHKQLLKELFDELSQKTGESLEISNESSEYYSDLTKKK